jgi:hypothetical protein
MSLLARAFARRARSLCRAFMLRGWPPQPFALILHFGLALLVVGLEGCALAPPQAEALGTVSQGITGGAQTQACAWPAVVALGGCSGTLVHPSLVVYAAHCGTAMTEARFGTDSFAPTRVAEVSDCRAYPGAQLGDGSDLAYCVLREPVLDVQPARILAGCEVAALLPGAAAQIVGFGVDTTAGEFGTQRAASTRVARVTAGELFLDSSESDTCRGDSGGPVFIEVPSAEGSSELRLAGVTSAGSSGECGQGVGHYINLSAKLAWLESSSGIDVTPCFDGETWKPTPACLTVPGTLPLIQDAHQAPAGQASAADFSCPMPAEAELSSTCGAPFALPPDAVPPTIELVGIDGDSLVHQLAYGEQYLALKLALQVEDDGWGVAQVDITLLGADGTQLFERQDQVAPYGIEELRVPPGTFELLVEARDYAGNRSSRRLNLQVIAPARQDTGCSLAPGPSPRGNAGLICFVLSSLMLSARQRRRRSSLC